VYVGTYLKYSATCCGRKWHYTGKNWHEVQSYKLIKC